MVNRIKTLSNIIIINPPNIFILPKNVAGHRRFRISCIIKNIAGILFSLFKPSPSINIIKDNPIRIYNPVQTGVKIQSGGLRKGLLRL
jgi:hypothetical protein